MKIGIDAHLVAYRRGMGNYVFNLIRWLPTISDNHEYVVYVRQRDVEAVPHMDGLTLRPLPAAPVPLWEHVLLPLAAARDRLDILHAPANTGPLYLPRSIALVVTIHDVMYLLPANVLPPSPSLYQWLGRIYRRLVVPRVARRATAIITVSNHSQQDIVQYLGIPPEHVFVIYEALGHAFYPSPNEEKIEKAKWRYRIQSQFVLALGGLDPRKNTNRILQAFKDFSKRSKNDYQLVIVGLPRSGQRLFSRTAMEIGIAEQTVFTGFVAEEDLVALYNGADVFLYPSLYEGFGLPVLEAMACGTPVIASTAGSIPEIAGEAALLIEPKDVEALASAIEQVITDQALRQELIARGLEHVKKFSWDKAARELLTVYERVMQV